MTDEQDHPQDVDEFRKEDWVMNTQEKFPENGGTEMYWEMRRKLREGPARKTGQANRLAFVKDGAGKMIESSVEDLTGMIGLYKK